MNKEYLTWLQQHDDPNELARSLLESSAPFASELEYQKLRDRASVGNGYYSQVIRALSPPPPKPTRAEREAREIFERMRKHNKATWPPLPVFKEVDDEKLDERPLPIAKPHNAVRRGDYDFSGISLRGDGSDVSDPSKYRPGKNDWEIELLTPTGIIKNPQLPRWIFWDNPFLLPPPPERLMYSELTTHDAEKVYCGLSFALYQHAAVMNTHVVIMWSAMGLSERQGAERLGKYLHEAKKWLSVGTKTRKRKVKNPRCGEEMHYAWIHEKTPKAGFHTHVLMNVPTRLFKQFEAWSRECLVRLNRGKHFVPEAFDLTPAYKDGLRALPDHWRTFRYVMKQLEYGTTIRCAPGDVLFDLREVIGPWEIRKSSPVPYGLRMSGVSHSIGYEAQRRTRFTSLLHDPAYHSRIYDGEEFEMRRQHDKMKEREELIASLVI